MRVIYLDAALVGELGHFAGACRSVTAALRKAGHEVIVCGHQQVAAGLKDELQVQPLFRLHPNARLNEDPLCGWLSTHLQVTKITNEDLARIQGVTANDLVVYDCPRPAQISAVVQWAQQQFRPESCPRIIFLPGWPTGVAVERGESGVATAWRILDQLSCLYRFAAQQIHPAFRTKIRFGCPDISGTAAEAYQFLLNYPVSALPAFQRATVDSRDRTTVTDPVVAFLGEQRFDKGYPLVPGIVRDLLAKELQLKILVQNSWDKLEEQNRELQEIAARDTRLTLRIGTLSKQEWHQQLFEADLVVLPYHPSTYGTNISGVGAEALANGIPQVVPANTGMARLVQRYGNPGVIVPASEQAAFVDGVMQAVQTYQALAARAAAAREQWANENTPENLAAALCNG